MNMTCFSCINERMRSTIESCFQIDFQENKNSLINSSQFNHDLIQSFFSSDSTSSLFDGKATKRVFFLIILMFVVLDHIYKRKKNSFSVCPSSIYYQINFIKIIEILVD